ncbi:deoxyguanosinetriphosphate triphosphohydrolase family protein [Mesotoga sp. BH458_6_3_2_1]|uniref:deoxyguanosinetriphosphate triphosphohydrolase family protein n=1 Tax=Mesotoga sp. BH458_6_3_2_1 TaxID=1437446 RepID=UPI000EF27A47|nr:HD domain-containing protein [Mesotoga sp. BH458_6_3_2_1]RLL85903.1 hypothetical protein Y697_13815 [Mesotoga sp. BH458_6_3_2_1]
MAGFRNPLTDDFYKTRIQKREEDIRGPYFRDQTAIIHCMAFRRMKKKTQVFFSPQNDHVCTRIEHSLHVSTIASVICKALGLDVEMAQAIALGHDIGHAPFGHAGEKKLNELASSSGGFFHEVQSLRVLDRIENDGKGLNLTYAVRDGIVSHCGEEDDRSLAPCETPKDLDTIQKKGTIPTTYEGCAVRFADKIAYLGRDIEDAITANIVKIEDVPETIRDALGGKNGEIIDTLVNDLVHWSLRNQLIGFSDQKFDLITKLKRFNYDKIYKHEVLAKYIEYVERIIETLFEYLVHHVGEYQMAFELYRGDHGKLINRIGDYIERRQNAYPLGQFSPLRVVIDYIAGMTDDYALKAFEEITLPKPIEFVR